MDVPPDEPVPECPRCRELEARLLELETRLRDLEDRLKALTKPPAKRPVEPPPAAPGKTPTGKKRGAQPGHKPHLKKWLPRERVSAVVPFVPEHCGACDAALPAVAGPSDPPPTIHQVAELPPILATVTEYQGHARTCACGHVTHAAKQIERGGRAKELGDRWQATQKTVFELWHAFRGGGLTRTELSDRLVPHVEALGEVLHAGTRTRDAVLVRHCERLLDRFPMLWLFASVEGVEPTNNHAERVQRRAVLWRRKSFGCQSPAGNRFVERILTAIQTLRLQKRNALDYLGQCLAAHRQGRSTPMLCAAG